MTRRLLAPTLRLLPLLLVLGVALAPTLSPAAPAVELILRGVEKPADADDEGNETKPADENLLSPAAAFELRFDSTMVAADQIGKEAADSPLIFTPALPGTFRWTSQRGGVYTLSEPPPLGASYQAALHGGLKNADGRPIAGSSDLKRSFHTPPLDIHVVIANATDDGDLPTQPKLQLLFIRPSAPSRSRRPFPSVDPTAPGSRRASPPCRRTLPSSSRTLSPAAPGANSSSPRTPPPTPANPPTGRTPGRAPASRSPRPRR